MVFSLSISVVVDISFVEQFFVLSEESNPEGICVAALSRTILEMSIDLIVTVVNGTAEGMYVCHTQGYS